MWGLCATMSDYKRKTRKSGFIALMSVIILSFALLLAVISFGGRGISGRLMLLDVERKSKSESLAEACVGLAEISIVNDSEYSVIDLTRTVGTGSCTIVSVEAHVPVAGKSTIKAQAVVNGATTNLKVVIDTATDAILSWEEVPEF